MWKRTLSIQSYFPDRNYIPSSSASSIASTSQEQLAKAICDAAEASTISYGVDDNRKQPDGENVGMVSVEMPSMNSATMGMGVPLPLPPKFSRINSNSIPGTSSFASKSQNQPPKLKCKAIAQSPCGIREIQVDEGQPSDRKVITKHMQRTNSAPLALPLPLPPRFPRLGNEASIDLRIYVPLYQAALKGDWEKAKFFIDLHPSALSAKITSGGETVLHIAAGAKQTKFVEELVELMNVPDLELQNKDGNTALWFAVASGNKKIVEVMVKKNSDLPALRGSKGVTPLHMAALLGHKDIFWLLYPDVKNDFYLTKEDYIGLLIAAISSDLYDVALHILGHRPRLAIEKDLDGETALHVLARKSPSVSGRSWLGIWQSLIHPSTLVVGRLVWCTNFLGTRGFHDSKQQNMQYIELVRCVWEQVLLLDDTQIGKLLNSPSRPLFVAVELGNFEFVYELVHSYPDLIWKVDEQSRSIFHIAVMHRQEKIFTLIYEIGAHKDLICAYRDSKNTNMLHLAGKLPANNRLHIVSGAALQLQRELLWFKEVEKNVRPPYKEMRDFENRTPKILFTDEHKELVKAGERWMKDTASSCMLVATLITTVMFAAIFTVPGGNTSKGTPIFLEAKAFILFAISDALALFSSVTAILMFLSILTSRYLEEDFLETLPKRLIIGLSTLFLSIASMIIAFSSTFCLILSHQLAWLVVPVAFVACIPVTLYAFLQFPLLADMIRSSYGSGIFARHNRDLLY